ncbi:phage major capsid protein [Corynebacterium guaraldiae]
MTSTTLLKRRDDAYAAAKAFRAEHSNMSADQLDEFKGLIAEVDKLDAEINFVKDANAASARLEELGQADDDRKAANEARAKSLGEHFVKQALARDILAKRASGERITFSSTEFDGAKAASDPMKVTGTASQTGGFLTFYDRTIVNQRRQELVMADIMGSANVTLPTIKYLVEKSKRIAEGAVGSVAEGTAKPYVRYEDFDVVTESLTKVAALTKLSDEMVEDAPFVTDWINNQLLYDLSLKEENDLLQGSGSGSDITGLLNRDGIQTHTAASQEVWADELYKAASKVRRLSPYKADAFVLNDLDWEILRLSKDKNGQYLAGGPFTGQYGNGNIIEEPRFWGKRVVTTDAIAAGTGLTGAFKQGSIVLRKGGVRVDLTDTNDKDFENNLVTMRAEERLGLMVPIPAAFVKVTLTGTTVEG